MTISTTFMLMQHLISVPFSHDIHHLNIQYIILTQTRSQHRWNQPIDNEYSAIKTGYMFPVPIDGLCCDFHYVSINHKCIEIAAPRNEGQDGEGVRGRT
jgi:hypothetical protein